MLFAGLDVLLVIDGERAMTDDAAVAEAQRKLLDGDELALDDVVGLDNQCSRVALFEQKEGVGGQKEKKKTRKETNRRCVGDIRFDFIVVEIAQLVGQLWLKEDVQRARRDEQKRGRSKPRRQVAVWCDRPRACVVSRRAAMQRIFHSTNRRDRRRPLARGAVGERDDRAHTTRGRTFWPRNCIKAATSVKYSLSGT